MRFPPLGTRPNHAGMLTMTDRSSREFYEIHYMNDTNVTKYALPPQDIGKRIAAVEQVLANA